MPSVGTLHTAKVAVTYTHSVDAVLCENTFYVRDGTDNLFSDPSGFASQVWTAALDHLVTNTFPFTVWTGVTFEDVRTVPFAGADFPQTPTAGSATGSTTSNPTSCALAVKKLTGALGRSGRGRWYWPLWNNGSLVSGDAVTTGTATAIAAALASFQAAVEGGTYPCEMGIVSYQTGGVARPSGFFEPITSWAVADLYVDSQRRRLLGRGR